MIGFIAMAVLLVGGCRRWPWWTPLAGSAALLPFAIIRHSSANSWRAEGTSAFQLPLLGPSDFALTLAFQLTLLIVAYSLGRGLRALHDWIDR